MPTETLANGIVIDRDEWRDIPGYEGLYAINLAGQVMGLRFAARNAFKPGRVLRNHIDSMGYYATRLHKNGGNKICRIHSLIALTFFGPRREGFCVNHKNGDKLDNRLENLEYVTFGENNAHSRRVLGKQVGEDSHSAKLKSEDIVTIRRMVADGKFQYEVAEIFKVSPAAISAIVQRRNWGHIE